MIVVDDELKPNVGVQKVRALLERDKVHVVVGVLFSNVMMAIAKPVFDSQTILLSPNAGPSALAGGACSPWFFSASWQNDQNHEVMGEYAQDTGYKKVVLVAPNYQAGKDAMAGFKRHYKGQVADEIFDQLNQLDFSAEMARIAALKPDAVFAFEPGGMGVNFVKQYAQAGLAGNIPFLSAFTVDETTLPATRDAALVYSPAPTGHPISTIQRIRSSSPSSTRPTIRAVAICQPGLRRGPPDRRGGQGHGRQHRKQASIS